MLRAALGVESGMSQIEAVAVRGVGVFETFKAILAECLTLIDDPELAPAGRSPSIVPGKHASMFPEAEPPALGLMYLPPPDDEG